MRILRNLLYIVIIVAGIILASANMKPVEFLYVPSLPFLKLQPAETEVPLALLLLAFLLAGALVAGTGTFVEHVRLRFLVRRNAKVVKGLRADLDKTRAALETAEQALATREAELAGEQARARRAEEAEAKAREAAEHSAALGVASADDVAHQLAPPPGA
ncbi:MAG TPA: lipopolysaccharide assembly protein LapA domain-containing protein [Candidatus Binatia bacterium]